MGSFASPISRRSTPLESWKIAKLPAEILKRDDITQDDLSVIDQNIEDMITEAIEYAQAEPEPTLDDLETDVYV